MLARIHQDYGRYLLRRSDLRKRGEGETERGTGERRKRSLMSVFVYRESGRAFFFQRADALARCFMAIVCARGKWHRNEIECYRSVNRQD